MIINNSNNNNKKVKYYTSFSVGSVNKQSKKNYLKKY